MTEPAAHLEQLSPLQRAALTIKQLRGRLSAYEQAASEPIAIVGLGCRFPGADTPEVFWEMLEQGRDALGPIPGDRWDVDALYHQDPAAAGKIYVRHGYFLSDVDRFDPAFFNLSPREAASLDPQQRLLLEVAWEALENAGYPPVEVAGGRTGVFVGIGQNDYAQLQLFAGDPAKIETYDGTGNGFCFASGRLAHTLRLRGPNLAIDTACSSSLVAIHLACQSLRTRECNMALAGGVQLMLSPEVMLFLCRARALSPDGRCKSFDAGADGFGRGEGCGVVVLKRLSDALVDGDTIRAVIRGSAVNHNGPGSGLTVPSGQAQQALLQQALAAARLGSAALDYVEAHGTGTSLGDPIEVHSLAGALRPGRTDSGELLIGSVKTNIGHLEAAAGIAGLIKVVLALEHAVIPASLHVRQPNPVIAWGGSGIAIARARTPWPRRGEARAAGVSSFGISGTNAHVILTEAPDPVAASPDAAARPLHVFSVSAKTPDALRAQAVSMATRLAGADVPDIADACFTANAGRVQQSHRTALVVGDIVELRARLADVQAGLRTEDVFTGLGSAPAPLAWLFTGQGSQYACMGHELYRTQPRFRRILDECEALLRPTLSPSLLAVWLSAEQDGPLNDTCYAQPALFVLQYALAELWDSWGVKPAALLGHSVGEYAAACWAGVFSLEDGLRLISARAQLMQALPRDGLMVAVAADRTRVSEALAAAGTEVAIAAVNGPRNTVISGRRHAVEAAVGALTGLGIAAQRLRTSHAFHSPVIDAMLGAFSEVAASVRFSPPRMPLISGLTGTVAGEEVATPEYWCRHAREPVEFSAGVTTLAKRGCGAFLEIGPAPVLLGMARQIVAEQAAWLPSLRPGVSDWRQMLRSLAARYVAGERIDWAGFDRDYRRRRVPLPTYPFERSRFWIAGDGPRQSAAVPEDALYRIAWQPAPAAAAPVATAAGCWVLTADATGAAATLAGLLEQRGDRCLLLQHQQLAAEGGSADLIRGQIAGFCANTRLPLRGVVHLQALDGSDAERTCGTALALVRGLAELPEAAAARIWCITRAAVPAGVPTQRLDMQQSALWGLGRSIALAYPALWGGLIDLDRDSDPAEATWLLAELMASDAESQVALRDGQRLVPRLIHCEGLPRGPATLRADATYLITGGLGELGRELARWLVSRGAVHLVLTGRRGPSAEIAAELAMLEQRGARLRTFAVDVADREAMADLLQQLKQQTPPLRGIFHAAGVAGRAPAIDIEPSSLAAILRPKLAGGLLLDALTEDADLDLFVCFSSIASLWGGKDQAHYAAANQALDALCHDRRARGLSALSVNWGPWASAGMASPDARHALQRMGITALEPRQNLSALERLMATDLAQAAVVKVDWSIFKPLHQGRGGGRLLDLISISEPQPLTAPPGRLSPLLKELQQAAPGLRMSLLVGALQRHVGQILRYPDGRLPDPSEGFFQLGMDSLMALELRERIAGDLGQSVPAALLFDAPSADQLADAILAQLAFEPPVAAPAAAPPRRAEAAVREPIAIVGMACRMPGGVNDPEQFWQMLREGRDGTTAVPRERWDVDAYYDASGTRPGTAYTCNGGFISDVALFDAHYFGITPREAAEIDPQHRLLLELSHAALENAGQPTRGGAADRTGVYVGLSNNDYGLLLRGAGETERIGSYYVTGNALNAAAGRVSYALGLKGPSLTVDTACSSSLVAVHLACRSLWAGDCDRAIAAGANLILAPDGMVAACRARMLSVDGRCKTFDAAADGYGRGEGCGVVVLKRLSQVAAGERIWALIRGSAANQDGRSSGFTVPNGVAQQQVLRDALHDAGVEPDRLGYVEAHGTGTPLGDPIEVGALGAVFGAGRSAAAPLLVGSVKANIGHLESAAGIAGLIKTVLVLHHGEIPRQIHLKRPNPEIPWGSLRVAPVTEHLAWPMQGKRLAGVSAFGLSGTNAHVVLEEPPQEISAPASLSSLRQVAADEAGDRGPHLLTISAKTPEALRQLADELAADLEATPDLALGDVCFTANGRSLKPCRAAWTVTSIAQARNCLRGPMTGVDVGGMRPRIAFLFSGEPASAAGMVADLYAAEPAFRAAVDRVSALLGSRLPRPLPELIRGDNVDWLADVAVAPSLVFAIDWALAELWKSWGITPDVVLGQGVGEHAAACVAGVTSLETALQLALRPDLPGPAADLPSRIAFVSAGEAKAGMTPPQRFAAALRGLAAADRCDVFLEVGPPAHLLDVGRECLPDHAALWLPSLESGRRARRSMLDSLGALYLKGADPDLREAYRGHPCRIVSLPTYPFQRRHHWCSSPAIERRSVSPGHPLLGSRLRSAVARSEIEYEARIIPRRLPFALSASAWLEMALAAGAELLGEGVVAVSDFRIGTAAASHPKGELALHLVLRPQGDQRYHFEILGSGAAADHWVSHASGVLDAGSPADPAPDQLDAIRARLAREQPLASVATPPEALTRLWVGFGEALGEIRLPDRYDLAFKLHPALLDASLQVAAAALASGSSAAHRQAVSIDRLSWHATPGDCLFTHAVLRATGLERIPVVDLSLLSADGALLATIAGLRLGAATAAEPIVENPLRDGLYEVHWQPQPLPGVPARGEDFLGHWLIFADRGGVADRVSDLLRARGNDTTLIRWSDHAAPDYRRVLLAAFAGKLPLRGMVHLWALDAGLTEQADTGALRTGIERGCRSALELTQALIAMQPTTLPLLWFASRGAVDTGDAPAIASPDGLVQAPLWGFAKVLASEHGEIPVRMIDLDPDRAADLTPLIDELLSSGGSGEDRVAFRSGGRLVGRLVRGALDDGARGSIRTDRSYLITGGLGEIGLQLAGWLIGQGARHLVLLGRGTGSPQAQAKLRALESAGARILVVQADVAQADAVAAVLARLGTDLPPLSGVFHAAGVVADRLLVQHSWPLFETVFAPKVEGAWVLHQLTRHLPLDFFVLFSSASTLLGGAGLANYVAANEFLDALAGYRRGLGLAALSIDWGPWAETGMAKDVGSSREAEWLAVGMHPLPPAAALHALGRALDGWTGRIGIMALDWSRMARHPSRRSLGHFADLLLPRGEPKPAPGQPSMRRRIEAAPGSARRSLLLSYVRAEAGSVIGWASGEPFSVNQGFFDLGMDSLQANELRNRLQSGLGCALPPTVVFKFPTVAALSTHLAQDVFGAEPVDGRAGEPSPDRSMAVDDADVVANIGRELVQLEKLLGG